MLKRGFKQLLAEANAEITTISPEQARTLLGDSGVVFIDIRDAAELAQNGRLPGAVHASRGLLEFKADPDSPLHDAAIVPDKKLVLFCASGGRSALAAKTLQDMGFTDVCHIGGGFSKWAEAGGDVDS